MLDTTPVFGFPIARQEQPGTTITNSIMILARRGMTSTEIANRLSHVKRSTIFTIVRSARARGELPRFIPRRGAGSGMRSIAITVSLDVYDGLKRSAAARNISVPRLIGILTDASVDCVDAILDDMP